MESSCTLNTQESTQGHQEIGMSSIQHSPFIKKKITSNNKIYKMPFKWYCQVCGLILTSKVQTQEHFFGKKHQNVIRNKNFHNQQFCIGLHIDEQSSSEKKSIILNRLHNSSKSSDQNSRADHEICDLDDVIPPPAGRDNILETVIKSEKKTFYSSDFSIYRTPSGKYYCQPCNITVNSQAQFLQHSESRKHKQKVSRASFRIK